MDRIRILSWNIQSGKGVDGHIDFARISAVIRQFTGEPPDVICLQEVSCGYPEFARDGQSDQRALLRQHFPDHRLMFGAAVDRWEGSVRQRFGNAILSHPPLLECNRHTLPLPLDTRARYCMPRQALEVVVEIAGRALRIISTHLEYFSALQRHAQADYLLQRQQSWEQAANRHPGKHEGPFRRCVSPVATVLCGDFNDLVASPVYELLTQTLFTDAWRQLHGQIPHAPTCGVHDRQQWEQGPHCRDYFFLSRQLEGFRPTDLRVDTVTAASDHQPLLLELGFG